ncbi:MAG: mannosyltransferase family protein [Firmicutes bacterium]|nr:mannosyltransferase family protein [Bacillota bacterium]
MARDWSLGTHYPPDTAPRVAEARAAKRDWPLAKSVAWIFVLSRLFFFEVASLAYIYLPHAWVEAPEGTLPPSGSILYHITAGLWVHWDGLWYLSIATYGYRNRPTATAFFPLYPLAMKLFGGGVIGGVVVSLLCFLVALWFLARLVTLDLGPQVAWYTLLALAFFPTAFYLNAVYSESLFLMLASGSLYFLRTRRYWLAGVMGALATLVSMYGILLVFPFLWLIWRREGFALRKLVHAFWMPLGLASYMAFLVPRFGYPLIFEKAQSNWGRHFEFFGVTLYQAFVSAYKAMPLDFRWHQLFATGVPSTTPSNFFNLIFGLGAIVLLIVSFRRIPFYLWIYALCALLIPFSYPATGTPLMSMPRLVLEAFPLFVGLGNIMARVRWTRAVYFVLAIPVGMVLTALFATAHWVA